MNPDGSGAHLLVVDDLEANRDLLARRVQRMGHVADLAENGKAAVDMLGHGSWDLVLLDITMPEMDGYETLRRIKDDPALEHIPVIMVSAIDETDSVVRCIELGAEDYLTKPFNPVILRARIESSLNKKRLADQKQATLQALARELEIGRRIQQGFLPQQLPQLAGWRIAALCQPARQVGGDFYDALTLPGGQLAFVVADVCDKGVGAALYMALFRSLLRAMLIQAPAGETASATLVRNLSFLNDYIAEEHGRDNMFATMFVGILDPRSGGLSYVNAGHDPPLHNRRATATVEGLAPTGPAVGMMPGARFAVASAILAPGDQLLAFTDGASEALGGESTRGEAILRELLTRHPDAPDALLAAVSGRASATADKQPPHDDVTLLSLWRAT